DCCLACLASLNRIKRGYAIQTGVCELASGGEWLRIQAAKRSRMSCATRSASVHAGAADLLHASNLFAASRASVSTEAFWSLNAARRSANCDLIDALAASIVSLLSRTILPAAAAAS